MRHLLVPFGLKPKIKEVNPYADMYVRALAACVDVFFLMLIYFDFFAWMDQRYFPNTGPLFREDFRAAVDANERSALMVEWVSQSIVQLFFFGLAIVGCQIAFQTTPGKWLIGIKIVRQGTHEPISGWRYVLRYLAYIPACVPLMLGMIWIGFNKQRRGWHDYIAGTVVLNMRPSGWYWGYAKRGFHWLRRKLRPASVSVEQSVAKPPAEQGHHNRDKPIE